MRSRSSVLFCCYIVLQVDKPIASNTSTHLQDDLELLGGLFQVNNALFMSFNVLSKSTSSKTLIERSCSEIDT